MKKEPILVPKNKCPLDVLAEMGEQTKSAWIFLHRNAVEKLISLAENHFIHQNIGFQVLSWNATDDFPKTEVCIEVHPEKVWLEIYCIDAEDIAFSSSADDPDNILFVKMDE